MGFASMIESDHKSNIHMIIRIFPVIFGIFILFAFLSACSSEQEEFYSERSVDAIYNGAMDLMYEGDHELAALEFDEVERQHPYSVWATKAKIMSAYNYYQADKYEESVIAAERFIELHPGHEDAGYAHYLIAMSYYERISDVGRDQKTTQRALEALEKVVRRFPGSSYARDARLKIDLAQDHLAGKEMSIGRYYLRRGHYIASVNRFRNVIENYQTTSHVPEALHRLVESYLLLGIFSEAKTAAAVLGYNYPGSQWYEFSYSLITGQNLQPEVDESSWIKKTFDKIF